MDIRDVRKNLRSAIEEYLSTPEAWDEAVVAVDTVTGKVDLAEDEESEMLPDTFDVYNIMDFIEMTPDGEWIPNKEAIDSIE